MTNDARQEPTPPDETVWPYIGVGCLTMVAGFFGGGMIAMLVGKAVGAVTGCRPPAGLPVCTWWRYWWAGAVIGLVGLPIAAILRLRRARATADLDKTG